MSKKLLLSMFAVSLLAACSSQPLPNDAAKEVAGNRVYSKSFANPSPDKGILIVKRDEGIYGSGCATKVYINAVHAANIRPGEKATLYVPAGKVIVSAEPSGICAGALIEEAITISQGQTLSLRHGYSLQGDVFLTETAF